MRRVAPVVVALLVGCAWSNSLYQARTLSNEATRDERAHRPGDAQSLWGQVTVKAESAYARSPRGTRGAEALWLVGHGQARSGNCLQAAPSLQRALLVDPDAAWRQELLLELAQCQASNRDPAAVSTYAALISHVTDTAIRRAAHLHQGHLLVLNRDWRAALAMLEHDDTLPARLDRATAWANLGDDGPALAELQPPLAAGDTTVAWGSYVGSFAAHDTPGTDSLLARLSAWPHVSDRQRAAWLFAAGEQGADRDTAASNRWLRQLSALPLPKDRSVIDGAMLQLQFRITRARSLDQLAAALDTVRAAGTLPLGSVVAARLEDIERVARFVVASNDSIHDGAPLGDLRLLMLAGFARDSLASPPVSTALLGRLERGWPQSPYLGKALLARVPMQPDSAAALMDRFRQLTGNAYVEVASGDVGARLRVAQLEDSLGDFAAVHRLRARAITTGIQ